MLNWRDSPWRNCALAGLLLLLLAAITFPQFPQDGHDIGPGFGGPVYAFEMARSMEDLVRVFGPPGDTDRDRRIAEMDAGNLWDYPFMAAYGMFIWTFFLAAARTSGHQRWRIIGALGPVAAVCDAIENQLLLGITPDLDSLESLAWLPYPVWLKFAALVAAAAGLGSFLWTSKKVFWRAAALMVWVACAGVPLAFYSPAEFGYLLGVGIGLAWVLQLAYAVVGMVD